jgi:hypothetical protein
MTGINGAGVTGAIPLASLGNVSQTGLTFGVTNLPAGTQDRVGSHINIGTNVPAGGGSGATQAISTVGSSVVTSSISGGTLSWSNAASGGSVTNLIEQKDGSSQTTNIVFNIYNNGTNYTIGIVPPGFPP